MVAMLGISQARAAVFDDADANKPVPQLTSQAAQQRLTALPVDHDVEFMPVAPASTATQAARVAARAPQRAITEGDFTNPSIQMDYQTTGALYATNVVNFTLDGNELTIENFGGYGTRVTANIDLETGAFTLPRQFIYNSEKYGDCDLVTVNSDFTAIDTISPVTGYVSDGVVHINPWVVYITSGSYKGYIMGKVRASTQIQAANATMNVVELDTNKVETTVQYPVLAVQSATNVIEVYNFAGISCMVNVGISGNTTMSIKPQLLYSISGYGSFYPYPYDAESGVVYLKQAITGTTTGNKLAWGGWAIQSSNGKYYALHSTGADIQLPFDITYPKAQTQAGFKGSGTEDDPYLIENIADLLALSDSVNIGTPTDTTLKYARAYEGVYFKQTAAINLKGYSFPPIGGSDDAYRFAGIYDGGNKVISNLTVNSIRDGYAGLFGTVDTCGVIRNVKLTSPVINSGYYYTGSLAGHCWGTVENVTVTNGTVNGLYCTGGVLGFGGATTNVSFTGTVVGSSQTGGVIGVTRSPVSYLSATNTTVTCTASGYTTSAGGVVGYLSTERGGCISDSYFAGTVISTQSGEFIGGIMGVNIEAPTTRCFSIANLYTTAAISQTGIGGIIGGAQASPVSDCFFTGEINLKSNRSGGIIGYAVNNTYGNRDNTTIDNCYVSCVLNGNSKNTYMPFLGLFDASSSYGATTEPTLTNCYYDKQMMGAYSTFDGGILTNTLASDSALTGFSTDVWTFAAGTYPRLTNIAKNSASYVATAPLFFTSDEESTENVSQNFTGSTTNSVKWSARKNGANGTEGYALNVESNSNFLLNGSVGTDTVVAAIGSISRYVIVKVAPASLFEGEGTEESPYLIRNKQDVLTLCQASNANKLTFLGTHFLVTNDIDMEHDTTFTGIGVSATATTYAFAGVLDGGNHTIDNLYYVSCPMNEDGSLPDSKYSTTGFINALAANGVVKNLRIGKGSIFEFYSRAGAIVGNNSGQIINCRNYADIKAHSGVVGGICGYSQKGSVITQCYNSGRITAGYQSAGGIVATSYATVNNCMNVGEVSCEHINSQYTTSKLNGAGGICQNNMGTITDVLNMGYIHAPKYVGGILAWYNSAVDKNMITNAVNVGILDYENSDNAGTIGNIVGKLYKRGLLENCYYDKQLSVYNGAHSEIFAGANPLLTAEITDGRELQGLSEDLWQFEAGKYPILKAFADEPGAQAGAISVVYFVDNARSDSIKHDCPLYQAEGLEWSVVNGSAFQILNQSLWMDPADNLTDTVVATYMGFTKRIPVVAVPDTVPVPEIYSDGKTISFGDELDGVTFYYTTDGTDPDGNSASVTEYVVVQLPDGTYEVRVVGTKHNYYPSSVASKEISIASGVDEIATGKQVASIRYITPAGAMTSQPVDGVNIVITEYTDGTRTVTKAIYNRN